MPRTKDRQGSRMSDRQMARAATSGRRIRFAFTGLDPISGYLVGSDDFHWLVATFNQQSPEICMVHKGSAVLITLSPDPALSNEDQDYQDFVERIGRGFFDFCDETYFSKTKAATKPQRPVMAVPDPSATTTRQENVS